MTEYYCGPIKVWFLKKDPLEPVAVEGDLYRDEDGAMYVTMPLDWRRQYRAS